MRVLDDADDTPSLRGGAGESNLRPILLVAIR